MPQNKPMDIREDRKSIEAVGFAVIRPITAGALAHYTGTMFKAPKPVC